MPLIGSLQCFAGQHQGTELASLPSAASHGPPRTPREGGWSFKGSLTEPDFFDHDTPRGWRLCLASGPACLKMDNPRLVLAFVVELEGARHLFELALR